MKIIKTIFIVILIMILIIVSCVIYAFKIEPYRVKINEQVYKTGDRTSNVKIAQFSDVHIKEDFTSQNFSKVVDKINSQNPDIVVFTGDLYDNYSTYSEDESLKDELERINAEYKFAVWGNRDYGGGASNAYEKLMYESGFKILKNETEILDINGKKIMITGIDDSMLGNPYIEKSSENADIKILLSHEPDAVDNYVEYGYNLALSGHSHGGQIDIPFVPDVNRIALSKTAMNDKYTAGMYTIDESTGQNIYVNTGIGTTHVSARFGVVPEVTLFDIYI